MLLQQGRCALHGPHHGLVQRANPSSRLADYTSTSTVILLISGSER